ncbi:MAG: isoprenyl transferase [Candidatus Omnitrophica bacterium]|nr:isoprenyl transferase [Candidatus Omnitrophota bacterium]
MPYHPSAEAQKLIDRLVGDGSAEQPWAGKPLPKHVAIIMDGNGRWAGDRGLPRIEGHREGIQSVRAVAQACRKLEIPYLTLYAFSTENWKRPRTEIAALMKLLRDFLKEEIPEMLENRIRLDSIGNIKKLPLYVQHQLSKTSRATKAGDMMQLTLALSYGSRDEITQAVKKIARKTVQGKIKESQITQELVSEHLFTAGMPDPDLMIRSSGELRVSNYLLWQIAYAEIHVTPVLWPDFRDIHFYQAILDYMGRDRRFGKVRSK